MIVRYLSRAEVADRIGVRPSTLSRYRLPDADGVTCLRELRRLRADVPVVMVTGLDSAAVAVEAIRAGAAD